jgi:DNA-binding NarL/FixJ family response regulator
MRKGASHGRASRDTHGGTPRPVLVVKVDVAGAEQDGARTRHCDVRLVRSMQEPAAAEQPLDADGGEVTAVVILRDATPSHVLSCVRAATRGGGAIAPELAGRLLAALGDAEDPQAGEPQLSEREYSVLRMLADGESTRGIAERLSYSERTVKNIVRDLLVKLNGKTRAHAVALAARQGVI